MTVCADLVWRPGTLIWNGVRAGNLILQPSDGVWCYGEGAHGGQLLCLAPMAPTVADATWLAAYACGVCGRPRPVNGTVALTAGAPPAAAIIGTQECCWLCPASSSLSAHHAGHT